MHINAACIHSTFLQWQAVNLKRKKKKNQKQKFANMKTLGESMSPLWEIRFYFFD